MTVHPDFSQRTEAHITGLTFAAIRSSLQHEAATRGLKIKSENDNEITIELMRGLLTFLPADAGVLARVQTSRAEWLQVLKEGLAERLGKIAPDLVEDIRWAGSERTGQQPSNFHFAEVQSVTSVGSTFLRIRASVPDLSGFQDDAIHFRLVLPPNGVKTIQWPTLAANGTTIWPSGEHALHRPVYTVRSIDRDAGTLDIDVFLHAGGRVTDWVSNARPGAVFGISGPVGSGVPNTNRVLAYADETAFPAIARILENLTSDATGHVMLLADEGAECAYPINAPDGVSVSWLRRTEGIDLGALAIAGHLERPDHYLWVACEKDDAVRARAAFKENKGDPAQSYISAYWSRT